MQNPKLAMLGVAAHAGSPSLRNVRQEDHGFRGPPGLHLPSWSLGFNSQHQVNQARWCLSVTQALWLWRLEEHSELQASLCYIVRLCPSPSCKALGLVKPC